MDIINHNLPFYANSDEGMHCFQACFKMVIKHFWPEEDYSLEELAEITKKKPLGYTWYYAGLIWLTNRGIKIEQIELFDNEAFATKGIDYLKETLGEEVAGVIEKYSIIADEQKRAKEFLRKVKVADRTPTQEELKNLLLTNHIAICTVNSRTLNKQDGYSGHYILVKGFDEKGFIVHDPGLPGKENRHIPYALFEKAWAYPIDTAKNITAIKL